MRADASILAASMALVLAGCVWPGHKNAAQNTPPAPVPASSQPTQPPQPLSVPQTRVDLPSFQPLDPAALTAVDTEPAQVELPPAQNHNARRATGSRAVTAPKPDAPSPVQAAPAEPERQPIQEVTSPDERKRLQDSAEQNKREARAYLDQARGRGLSPQEKNTAQSVEQLLRSSDDSQARGDVRAANDLAYKAMVLARDLQNVR